MRAEFSTSSGSSQPCGLPVSTAQNWQARVHTAPISISVAVPLFQHSPMFGQIDSSHTVASRCARTVARKRSKRSPLGSRAFSHGGLRLARRRLAIRARLDAVLDRSEPLLGLVLRSRSSRRGCRGTRSSCLLTSKMLRPIIARHANGVLWAGIERRGHRVPKYITPEGAAALRARARRAVARQAAGRDASGRRSGRAGRPLRERRIHLRQEAARRDRPARALFAQAARRAFASSISSRPTRARSTSARGSSLRATAALAEYRLVGPDETDYAAGYISIDSPLGRAVLGKGIGAEIVVSTPEGEAARSHGVRYLPARNPWREKKSPAEAGRVTGGNRKEEAGSMPPCYCNRAQLIKRTSPDRRSKLRASRPRSLSSRSATRSADSLPRLR